MTKLVDTCKQYKQAFKENGLDIQIMPLRADNKNPMRKHKGGVYNDSVIFNPNNWYDKDNSKPCNFGLLMNEQVFCIDLDGVGDNAQQKAKSAAKYFAMIKDKYDLSGAWIEKTRKGYHLIWKKPKEMQDVTLATDAFKQAGLPGIDLVTITGSIHDGIASKAILAVYPSKNKQWLDGHNPLQGDKLSEPPVNLVAWINENINKTKPKNKTKTKTGTKTKITVSVRRRVMAHGTEHEIRELQQILKVLPSKYFEDTGNGGDWNLWFKVMLGVQYLMGESGYSTWIEFNKRASCYTTDMQEDNKRRYWDENIGITVDKPVKMGSFRYWCKTDNPQAWQEIKKNSLFQSQLNAVSGTWYDKATLAALELEDVFYDQVTNSWVKFDNGIWDRDYQQLIVDLNEIVSPRLKKTMTSFYQKLKATETDDDKRKECDKKIKSVTTACNCFGNEPQRIISQMKSICGKTLEFDNNPWLLGFKDGWVYDLKQCEFRPAEREDMVSLYCGVTSHKVRNSDTQEIRCFLEDILPDKEVRDYQLYLFALALNGVEAKRFACQNGSGANGKSTLMDLATIAYGDYIQHVSTELYTRRLAMSGPKPELIDLNKKRFFVATEPGEGEQFHSDAIKKMTGGDPITCRGMHWIKTITFSVTGQHNVLCNGRPELKGMDGGVLRRIVNFYYPVKFVANPDPKNPYEKPINMKFKTRSWAEQMAPAFIKLLIETHDECIAKDEHEYQRQPPDSIMQRTNAWFADSNPLKVFLEEEFLGGCQPNPNGCEVTAMQIYAEFRKTDFWNALRASERKKWTKKRCFQLLVESSQDWKACYKKVNQGTFLYLDPCVSTIDLDEPEL